MKFLQRLFGRGKKAEDAGKTRPAAGVYIEPASGLRFPMDLGGLRRLAAGRPYSEGDRTGHSIPYGAEQAQATIYITTVGQADFPDGGKSDFIRGELESAFAAVREMERLGRYESVKFYAGDPEILGNDPGNLVWVRGAFFTVTKGRPMISMTYITALRRKVIKLRLSTSDPQDQALAQFPKALGDLISQQRSGAAR